MLTKAVKMSEVRVKFSAIYLESFPGFFGNYLTFVSSLCL
jgi:hypothetical protein